MSQSAYDLRVIGLGTEVHCSRIFGRRGIIQAAMCLSASGLMYASSDLAAWRAYEAVEEAWIHERHAIMSQQAPAALNAVRLDLEIQLAELQKRALEYRYLVKHEPERLSGGVWQLVSLSVPPEEVPRLKAIPDYKKLDERIRQLRDALGRHPQNSILRRAQSRLWKTPQYRDAHRKYTGRLQELQLQYGGTPAPSSSTVN